MGWAEWYMQSGGANMWHVYKPRSLGRKRAEEALCEIKGTVVYIVPTVIFSLSFNNCPISCPHTPAPLHVNYLFCFPVQSRGLKLVPFVSISHRYWPQHCVVLRCKQQEPTRNLGETTRLQEMSYIIRICGTCKTWVYFVFFCNLGYCVWEHHEMDYGQMWQLTLFISLSHTHGGFPRWANSQNINQFMFFHTNPKLLQESERRTAVGVF